MTPGSFPTFKPRHPLHAGEGKERKGTSPHVTRNPLPSGQDGAFEIGHLVNLFQILPHC